MLFKNQIAVCFKPKSIMNINKDREAKKQNNTHPNMATILVAVDFSEVTSKVYEVASHLAERLQASVTVLNISEPHGDYIAYQPVPIEGFQDSSIEAHATQKLMEAKVFFNAHGLSVDTLHHWGPAVERILDEAKLRAAGLIVIGSHGHGLLYNLLAGSGAEGVLRGAHVPVLVVPTSGAKTAMPIAEETPQGAETK